ncbi:hypothetical protein ML462_03905 [Gramella lutea]|uniref:Uncharacterized protein n=1 Tax=Christiangramia lutea TaxID=1607951 RepID=A0A9X1V3S4_9FLAO|nr:hypothetical protein [Christiangramia lutea]MCH4822308.1 hypothetical protein [Christiangramia lutea]
MRIIAATGILFIMFFLTSCGSSKDNSGVKNENQYTGIIEPAGVTTYQYGTHRLQTKSTYYALRSESIDLSVYEDQKVTVTATEVEGYPLEGGPIYLEVESIEK